MQDLIHSMEEIGGRHGGKTPAQVALNWLIRQTGVFPIPGAKTALQVRESAGALGWEMSAEEAGHLDHLSRSLA
jgi:aryl-alcohol dehydrogenase-like predicted oxidoreductase